MAGVPEPTPPFDVRAIANFTARSANEMSIEAGKNYKVIQTDGKGLWWNTQGPNGNYGWFPANYVELVTGSSPPTAAPTPQPAVQQSQLSTSQQSNPQSTLTAASFASSTPPTPSKPVHKDKGNSPTSIQLHIVTARGLKFDSSLCCQIFLYHIIEHKDKDGRLIHKTSKIKKSKAPEWNEKFEIFITDAETEVVRVRLLSKKKKKIGDVMILLRATVRAIFTSPNSEYKWHKLQGGEGEVNIWIQYTDTRHSTGPPAPPTRGGGPPPPPPPSGGGGGGPSSPHLSGGGGPSSPHPSGGGGGPPPPPPPSGGGARGGGPPPPPPPGGGGGPPPPPGGGARGGGGMSLADQLANRGNSLKSAGPPKESGSLADQLANRGGLRKVESPGGSDASEAASEAAPVAAPTTPLRLGVVILCLSYNQE